MPCRMKTSTTVQRKSDRELVATCTIDAPPAVVFQAWANADQFARWWVPKSMPISLRSCALDVRVGGTYRLVFSAGDQEMAFFGRYLEVTPNARLVWTNEEGGEAQATITTVTLEERDGKTLVVMSDLHATKELLDEAIASGGPACTPETFEQLNTLVAQEASPR